MAAGQNGSGRTQLVPEAHANLDNMKYEIATEFAIPVHQGSEDYWGEIPSRDCGRVGGNMVKRMIAFAEQEIAKGNIPNKV
jgi:small acid-soluble spore protein A (major alpha-type SASP)